MRFQLFVLTLTSVVVVGGALIVAAKHNKFSLKVQEKLYKFGQGRKPATGLTYDVYLAAYGEIRASMKPADVEKSRLESPEARLFLDFVYTPMARWHPQADDDETYKQAYVKRMEHAYKRFYPAYVEQRILGEGYLFKGPKFSQFIKALRKRVNEQPTVELWKQSMAEYRALASRAEEMVKYEDIYEQLDDYEQRLNYLNHPRILYVLDNYADKLNKCKTDADIGPIVAAYRLAKRIH